MTYDTPRAALGTSRPLGVDDSSAADKPYVAMARHGDCKICGSHEDLRMGACWTCADFVDGERLSPTTHRLWDSRNPANEWFCSETGDA